VYSVTWEIITMVWRHGTGAAILESRSTGCGG
jgi:hypothetical protein